MAVITNYNNQFIKIESEFISDLIQNINSYTKLQIVGNINCCKDSSILNLEFTTPGWYINLEKAVNTESILDKLIVQNTNTSKLFEFNVSNIDTGYVNANCTTNTCTLQSFSGYFKSLLEANINSGFNSIGVVSNVNVTIINNTIIITNLPSNFLMYSITYENNKEEKFSYGSTDSNVYLQDNSIYIKPEFFNLKTLIDGVYKFDLTYYKAQSNVSEFNCSFIDITTKCKVASVLNNIKRENETKGVEKCSTIIHLLHYSLTNGSNCGCNCEELCKVYEELYKLIGSIDPQILNNCGC